MVGQPTMRRDKQGDWIRMTDGFTIIERRRAHDGFLQLDTYRVRQQRFDGGVTPILEREVIIAADCVGVLLYDPAEDAVILVEQARLPAALQGLPAIQTEIVAGRIEAGETPLEVVRREVTEETGCTILGEPEPISVAFTNPGYNTERMHVFCARVDAKTAGGLHGVAAEDEDIRVLVLPFAEFQARQADGRITNIFTLYAGLWLALNRERLRGG
jgi:ADP-ribose pyrophosphatase